MGARLVPMGALAAVAAAGVAGPALASGAVDSRFDLANRCFALKSVVNDRFVAVAGSDAYRVDRTEESEATGFHLKPSGLGRYLPHDQGGNLLGIEGAGGGVRRVITPGPLTEWAPERVSKRSLSLRSTATGRRLAVDPASGELITLGTATGGRSQRFELVPHGACTPFPEAGVGAVGRPAKQPDRTGIVSGFADAHLHVTAEMRAGGRVLHGESFDRFGITRALGGDEANHGPDGSLDVTGNLLRSGLPFGTHDTHGWPTFAGWPTHDTNTHQQVYYAWLKRAWMAGMRLVVAQTIEDQPMCEIEPVRSHSCDETETIELEVQRLRALQHYVDAQSGGPGRGWFRLVYNPRQARRVIERGKLAVVIGAESSNLFGCSVLGDRPQCSRADVDRGIRNARRLGVRSLFVTHWVDNAFGGAALEGGAKGIFINVFNRFQTGRYFETEPCPEPSQGEEVDTLSPGELGVLAELFPAAEPLAAEGMPTYPPGPQCNARGLTKLGGYLIRRLMAEGMLIEADHLSEKARARVLDIAEARDYPLVSSHTGTGGTWTASQLRRLYRLGGFASATPDQAPELAAKILDLSAHRSDRRFFGVPLGTDTGGFSSLPGPREDAARDPLEYPFKSYLCNIKFGRQQTGERTYDLNTDGVAHYGLFPDLLADVQRQDGGQRALRLLSRSAEAYLRTWRRAARGRPTDRGT
jgi:microsomal dipeptidase-like Zn-dependent dipeptidase